METWKLKEKHFKKYYHFDNQIDFDNKDYIQTFKNKVLAAKLEGYKFLPFIRTTLKIRKLSKIKKYQEENKIKKVPDSERIKTRILTYCGHKDALVFNYYRHLLSEEYERFLKDNDINNNVIAYRKIETSCGSGRCKSNINFAAEAFSEVVRFTKKYNKCAVLTFDISNFFDNIDHRFLYKQLCKILRVDKLSKDWYKIFCNITKFHYVELKDVKKVLKDNKIRKDIKNKTFFPHIFDKNKKDLHSEYFRKFILGAKLLKKNNSGIPQGSPISDILANLYLNEFDIALRNLEKEYSGFYRRYCDDIIFICKNINEAKDIENKIIVEIEKQTSDKDKILKINEKKTTKSYFKYENGFAVYDNDVNYDKNYPLVYLGFEMTNNNVIIKNSSLSKRFRKIGKFVKNYINDVAYKAYINNETFPDNLRLIKLYRSLFCSKKNNKYKQDDNSKYDGRSIKYILMARKIFENLNIKQLLLKYNQLRKTKSYIKSQIEKYIKLCKKRYSDGYYLKQQRDKKLKNKTTKNITGENSLLKTQVTILNNNNFNSNE